MNQNTVVPAKILLTTDFSESASCALPYALGLAKRHGSELIVLHVIAGDSEYVKDRDIYKSYQRISREKAFEQLAAIEFAGKDDIKIRREITTGWSAKDGIVDFAKAEKPDLIIISTHGHGVVGRFFLGSVARSVTAEAPCPVLCVKCGESGMLDEKREEIHIERIMVPVDLSEDSRVALKLAVGYAKAYRAQLHLIYVVHVDVPPALLSDDSKEFFELDKKLHSRIYERLQAFHREVDPDVEKVVTMVEKGSPAKQIARYAESHEVDLILLSRKGLGRTPYTLGGVVGRLLHEANCPTLVI